MPPIVRVHPVADLPADTRAAWTNLYLRVGQGRPQMSPDYVSAVDEVFHTNELAEIADQNGMVRAVLPFSRNEGDIADAPLMAVCDGDGPLVDPGFSFNITDVLAAAGLRSFEWGHAPVDVPGLAGRHGTTAPAAVLDLSQGFEAYRTAREAEGTSIFKQTARKRRKLEREVGEITVTLRDSPDLAGELAQMKARQLRAIGLTDSGFRGDGVVKVIQNACSQDSEHMSSFISTLRAGSTVVAMHWWVASNSHLVSVTPTHGLDYEKYSPGTVLTIDVIEQLADKLDSAELGLAINQMKASLMTHTIELGRGKVSLLKRDQLRDKAHDQYLKARIAFKETAFGQKVRRAVLDLRSRRD